MKISEIINQLVEIKSEYGDLECRVLADYFREIESIKEPNTRYTSDPTFVQIFLDE